MIMNKYIILSYLSALAYLFALIFIVWAIVEQVKHPSVVNPTLIKWQSALVLYITADFIIYKMIKNLRK